MAAHVVTFIVCEDVEELVCITPTAGAKLEWEMRKSNVHHKREYTL